MNSMVLEAKEQSWQGRMVVIQVLLGSRLVEDGWRGGRAGM